MTAAEFREIFLSVVHALESYNGTITALATVAIGVFTYYLVRVTNRQAILTCQLIELSQAEIVSNYRPRLRVRNVFVRPNNLALVSRMGIFQPNAPVDGQLYAVNIGGTPATITESHCIVFITDHGVGLPMRRPYEGENGNNLIPQVRLEPGQSTPGMFMSDGPLNDRATTIGQPIAGGLRLWVMGWIEYVDDRAVKRRTTFCRECERREGFGPVRFYTVDDPDYEHEE